MTGLPTDLPADDWVYSCVLVVARRPYRTNAVDAVQRAWTRMQANPLLVDVAAVNTADSADVLAGDVDEVAGALQRELVDWALSTVAPACTFCLVVIDPDPAEAEQLMRGLAATSALSALPVAFRVVALTPDLVGAAGGSDELGRAVIDAVEDTVRGIEQTPGFWLPRGHLRELVVRPADTVATADLTAIVADVRPAPIEPIAVRPGSEVALRPRSAPVAPAPIQPAPIQPAPIQPARIEPARIEPAWNAPAPEVPPRAQTVAEAGGGSAGRHAAAAEPEPAAEPVPAGDPDPEPRRLLGRLAGSVRSPFATRPTPASNIDIIEELSGRPDAVSMLYLVMVAEPVRPPKGRRQRQSEVALRLTRAMRAVEEESRPWYVRAFTAGRHLYPEAPLDDSEHLRDRDFPGRWGEHADLFDCLADVVECIERDTASFVVRGGHPPEAFVVFLAADELTVRAELEGLLDQLCDAAAAVWLSFDARGVSPTGERASARRVRNIRDHDDIVAQLRALLLADERAARSVRRR